MTRRQIPTDLAAAKLLGFVQVLREDDPGLAAPGQLPFAETRFAQKLDTGYEWIGQSECIVVLSKFLREAGSPEEPFPAALALWRRPISKRFPEAHFL